MLNSARIPVRGAWVALIVLLALTALVRIAIPVEGDTLVPSLAWAPHVGWMLGLLATLWALITALVLGVRVSPRVAPQIDHRFLLTALSWLLTVVLHGWAGLYPGELWAAWAMHASYQLTAFAVACFLLACAPRLGTRAMLGLCGFAMVAAQLALWAAFGSGTLASWGFQAWRMVNVVGDTVWVLWIGQLLLRRADVRSLSILGACLMGLGIKLADMAYASAYASSLGLPHYGLGAYLLLLWMAVTQRLAAPGLAQDALAAGEETAQGEKGDGSNLQMRRRLAQDLHDGVGSQIVGIISTLDPHVPEQAEMASALEQCLFEVKILVDDIEDSQESVLESLGRLRHRVQQSLDHLGIALSWEMEFDGPLGAVPSGGRRPVLRLAQEALANVMRHAHARHVAVRCVTRGVPPVMVLEVQDDGVGFDAQRTTLAGGRGLAGMHRRAAAMGGRLLIEQPPGGGTLVRLEVPL